MKINPRSFFITVSVMFLVSASSFGKAKIVPVTDISLLGGQYYLDGEKTSFGGNSYLFFSPVVNLSTATAILPIISANYSGTKDVQELVGGGSLVQQSFDYGINLKYVTAMRPLTLKARVGYRDYYINETEDEDWGNGLFDYSRIMGGVQLEKRFGKYLMQTDIDYYTVSYPNYKSLVSDSEYELSIDTTTYSEISQNAGEDVLDYTNISFGIRAERPLGGTASSYAGYVLDLRNYKDQTVVTDDGSFSSTKRKDTVHTLTLGLEKKLSRTIFVLENQTGISGSNQNSFDAGAAKYIEDYYSYIYTGFIPSFSLYLGEQAPYSVLRFYWDISLRYYSGRYAQDKEGDYLDDKTSQTDNTFGVSYSYPVSKKMSAIVKVNRHTSSSNMKYEADYKYNYTVTNYFAGINIQF